MISERRAAGIGAVAFGVLTVVGLLLIGPVGGEYDEGGIADYLSSDHRPLVFVGLYVGLLATLGLMVVLSYLRKGLEGLRAAVTTTAGTAAVAGWIIGWSLLCLGPLSLSLGGAPGIDPEVSYMFAQAGWFVLFFAGAAMLGIALLAAGTGLTGYPAWVRWATVIAGLACLATTAYFPFFLLLLWALVVGIWLAFSAEPQTA